MTQVKAITKYDYDEMIPCYCLAVCGTGHNKSFATPTPFFCVSCVGYILLYHSSSFFTHSEECQPFVACCTSTMMIYLRHIGQGNPGNEESIFSVCFLRYF
ncbi:hypothetical protein OUZ56_027618 [Daphnia magna]|uniref:Uncharacterized protein n=1 Tax=Daphnia magna TaxID=35525 RepID=A0ABR0B1G4_9CRUS|nr:hypothetical protein OUZ56_027618 [Daphnia magna]